MSTLRDTVDCSPPGSSVHGILQARILEQVAMPSSRGSSHIYGAGIAGGFFIAEPTEKAFGQLGCCKNYNQQGSLHN